MSDDALFARVRGCRLCADRFAATATAHAPRPVLWLGTGARVLIAGQADLASFGTGSDKVSELLRIMRPDAVLYLEQPGLITGKRDQAAVRRLTAALGLPSRLWLTPLGGEMHTAIPEHDQVAAGYFLRYGLTSRSVNLGTLKRAVRKEDLVSSNRLSLFWSNEDPDLLAGQTFIQTSAAVLNALKTKGETPIVVGVNDFVIKEPPMHGLHKLDPRLEQSRSQHIAAARSARDADAARGRDVRQALDALRQAAGAQATGDNNLMVAILRAVKADATLGEIADVLRNVFGEYDHTHGH